MSEEKKDQYLVLARKWGDVEGHTYAVGLYGDEQEALDARLLEIYFRAGKYDCDVLLIQEAEKWHKNGIPNRYIHDCWDSDAGKGRVIALTEAEVERLAEIQ